MSRAQGLSIYKAIKVVVIFKNQDFIFSTFKTMLSCLKSFYNNKKFIIMSHITSFYRNYFPRKKRYYMLLAEIGLNDYLIRLVTKICWLSKLLMV